MNLKKYIKLTLVVGIVFISIKPLLFTWNFIQANYQLQDNKRKAGAWIYKSLAYNPSAYKVLTKYYPKITNHLIIKTAIYYNDINRLKNLGMSESDISRLQSAYTDNFYFQHLLKNLHQKRNWQNLDEVSLELLADKSMNKLTISIFEKIDSLFNEIFINNLIDYCNWQRNIKLSSYLQLKYNINREDYHLVKINYFESIQKLQKMLALKFKFPYIKFENNLLACPTFDNIKSFESKWDFIDMTGKPHYSNGSFTIGLDENAGNSLLRIMGFHIQGEMKKERPRGGARSYKSYSIESGYYIFSFDYLTKTGQEAPSIYLKKGVKSVKLPASGQNMKKVVFIINNSANTHHTLRPLFLMWGTGTVWIDNVYLGKITNSIFSLSTPYALLVEEWK